MDKPIAVTESNDGGTQVLTRLPHDVALNAAVRAMAASVYPTGYDVLKENDPTMQGVTVIDYKKSHLGRTPVPECTDPSISLFADTEVEQDFMALIEWAIHHPTTQEGHEHPGSACIQQLADATARIGEKLTELYGDEPRTRQWDKDLTIYFLANIGFSVWTQINNAQALEFNPRRVFDLAVTTGAGVFGSEGSPENIRQEFIAYVVNATAPRMIVVGLDELDEVLAKLAMPTDDTGKQNAPTSAARN